MAVIKEFTYHGERYVIAKGTRSGKDCDECAFTDWETACDRTSCKDGVVIRFEDYVVRRLRGELCGTDD